MARRDIAANTAMLSDPGTARFITADGKPVTDRVAGWRNAAVMAGHWALHGFGMFVVEEKSSGKFVGRVGPWSIRRAGRGLRSAGVSQRNSVARAMRSKRRGRRSTGSFATFEIDEIIHCIDRENTPSQAVARRLGASKDREVDLFGKTRRWVTHASAAVAKLNRVTICTRLTDAHDRANGLI